MPGDSFLSCAIHASSAKPAIAAKTNAAIAKPAHANIFLERINHSFEAGRRGKPDELESILANLVGAYFLKKDRAGRFDLRVSGTIHGAKPLIRVSGEISEHLLKSSNEEAEIALIITSAYNKIHKSRLKPSDIEFNFNFKPQSHGLAQNNKAGDSGEPISVAYAATPAFLPWERHLAVSLRNTIDWIYAHNGNVPANLAKISGVSRISGLRADGKIQVNAVYEGTHLIGLSSITIASEHEKTLGLQELRDKLFAIIHAQLGILEKKYGTDFNSPHITVNGCGAFNVGGWLADEGTREAKPYRDGFATYGVMEDSFSGEDSSKPSGTGTILARHIAVSVVGNNIADFARVALSYVIGKEEVELNITTNGTSKLEQAKLEGLVRRNFDLSLSATAEQFDLRNPSAFLKIARNSDYFHDPAYPWNKPKPLIEDKRDQINKGQSQTTDRR